MIATTIKQILIGLFIYIALLALLIFEPFQSSLVYLHWLNFPSSQLLSNVTNFQFGEGMRVRNFYLMGKETKSDGKQSRLGVYHFLPKSASELPQDEELNEKRLEDHYLEELVKGDGNVVIFLHGNAGNRASPIRYPSYQEFTLKLDAHLFVLDYRGFGDSSGYPSEHGLFEDSLQLWSQLVSYGVQHDRITIVGHSLGTGVAAHLAKYLNEQGVHPRTLMLSAPYTSIYEAMYDYKLFRILPLLLPLKTVPGLQPHINKLINHRFETINKLHQLKTPTLIIHGNHDIMIPVDHSRRLFNETVLRLKGEGQQVKIINEDGLIIKSFTKGSKVWEDYTFLRYVEADGADHDTLAPMGLYSKVLSQFWLDL